MHLKMGKWMEWKMEFQWEKLKSSWKWNICSIFFFEKLLSIENKTSKSNSLNSFKKVKLLLNNDFRRKPRTAKKWSMFLNYCYVLENEKRNGKGNGISMKKSRNHCE